MDNLFNSKMINANDLFGDYYLNEKALYLHCFNALPNNYFIGQIDGEKAFGAFREKFGHLIKQIYTYRWHDKAKKCGRFSDTLVILDNACLIKFDTVSCDIWHNGRQPEFIDEVANLVSPLREKQRREPREVNLVIRGNHKLELKAMEIKRIKLNLDLFYGEEFKAVDELIRKRVLFISPSVAGDLMNPDFIQLLTSNPDSVVIIEDAENVIMDRKHSPGSSVSNLLNISDGLLADFLNVQLICTFNNSLTLIDSALLRKGRLIAKHEFGKLSVKQSQRLSDHLGFDTVISRPMTVAEIGNQHEQTVEPDRMEVIGFRKHTPVVE